MNDPARRRPLPQWVAVVVSIVLIAGLAMVTCAVGVGVLAPRAAKETNGSASAQPVAASTDDFVMVVADKTQAPSDVFAAAAVTASARGLRPFAYATASWCEPCKKLAASLSDPRMKDAFKGTYIVKVDVDDFDAKALAGLGMRVRGVPSFFELGADGTPTGRALLGDWGADVPENMAPALQRFFSQ